MTVVVADSSPLNYLTLIESVDVLRRLYGSVVVPQQVVAELIDSAAPHDVRRWASDLPDWIDVRGAVVSDDDMAHLDPGERAAIALAEAERGALLLIDETAGRIEASRRGIRNTGTLGLLRAAALEGYVDLPAALARLLETTFRVSMELVSKVPGKGILDDVLRSTSAGLGEILQLLGRFGGDVHFHAATVRLWRLTGKRSGRLHICGQSSLQLSPLGMPNRSSHSLSVRTASSALG